MEAHRSMEDATQNVEIGRSVGAMVCRQEGVRVYNVCAMAPLVMVWPPRCWGVDIGVASGTPAEAT